MRRGVVARWQQCRGRYRELPTVPRRVMGSRRTPAPPAPPAPHAHARLHRANRVVCASTLTGLDSPPHPPCSAAGKLRRHHRRRVLAAAPSSRRRSIPVRLVWGGNGLIQCLCRFVPFLPSGALAFREPKRRKNAKKQDSGNRSIVLVEWEFLGAISTPDGPHSFGAQTRTWVGGENGVPSRTLLISLSQI